jgi:diguanylate cyclase
MKAHLAHVLETIHGQSRNRQNEVHLRTLQSENLQLQRVLREKETEITQLSCKIENLEAQLQEMMAIDSLTGLPNRQSFRQHLLHSVKRALRLGYSLSLLVLDVDHLQEINNNHGYETGNLILTKIAEILRNSVREVDMAGRWDGEELVAVLHETDADGAAMVAERIRKRVLSLGVRDPKSGQPVSVSVSLAVAGYLPHNGEAHDLIENAFQSLTAAKTKGCNCVVIAAT